jgi:hypothetical protein
MILNSTEDLKKHVAVMESFNFPNLQPYVAQAADEFTYKYVGDLHEILADETTQGESMAVLNKARGYLQAALANFSLYIYTPVGTINIDSSGMGATVTPNRAALSWGEKKDIQRNFLSAGHKAMDRLLAFMEKNKDAFPEWAASNQYTESNKLLVNNTAAFNSCYTINESRQTYLALQPAIAQVEDQYIRTFLCPELIKHLKTAVLTDVQAEVKEYLQKAIVAFTVAKVADEGIFTIDASSIMLNFSVLTTDKPQAVPTDWLTKTVTRQTQNGENYLKLAANTITKNIEQFNQCAVPIIVGDVAGGFEAYNTQSTLML